MILSDREIQAAIATGRISVTECPPQGHDRWSSTTLDLTLDAEIRPWQHIGGGGAEVVINPASQEFNSNTLIAQHTTAVNCADTVFILEPQRFVLGWTVERIRLPHTSRIGARVEGKSSLARIGIGIHVTAPTIHPGFGHSEDPKYLGSPIRLEIWNVGTLRVRLTKGMAICQIIFEEVHGTPAQGYSGQYVVQGPQG